MRHKKAHFSPNVIALVLNQADAKKAYLVLFTYVLFAFWRKFQKLGHVMLYILLT